MACSVFFLGARGVAGDPEVTFKRDGGTLAISIGGKPFAEYVFDRGTVARPYFSNVYSPAGIKVTRHHPPKSGDQDDHPHHTGIFMTFGNLNGVDYWHARRGKTVFAKFLQEPERGVGKGSFVVRYQYRGPDGTSVLREDCRHTIRVTEHGYLIEYDGTFTAEVDCTFGSVEEGGMAARVATPIAVDSKKGGKLVDSKGRSGGTAVWGKRATWVDYGGPVDRQHVGLTIMSHPKNFSGEPWWHARDYGLFAANPFGPLNKGKPLTLEKGKTLRLRFGVLAHSEGKAGDYKPTAALETYLKISKER